MTNKAAVRQLLAIRDFKVKILSRIKEFEPRQQYIHEIRKDIEALDTAVAILKERNKA